MDGLSVAELSRNLEAIDVKPSSKIPQFILDDVEREPIETIREVASRRIIDTDGVVEDITYTQNGKTISISDRFPGTYTISLHRTTREALGNNQPYIHFSGGRNEVVLTVIEGEPEDDFNVELLHEFGHYNDETTERKKYVVRRENLSFVRYKTMQTLKDDLLSAEEFPDFVRDTTNSIYAPQEHRQGLTERLWQEYQTYARLSPTQRQIVAERIGTKHLILRTQCILSGEQAAYLDELKVLREFRREGINVYGGTQEELIAKMAKSYSSYQHDDDYFHPLRPIPTAPDRTPSKLAKARQALTRLSGRIGRNL